MTLLPGSKAGQSEVDDLKVGLRLAEVCNDAPGQ